MTSRAHELYSTIKMTHELYSSVCFFKLSSTLHNNLALSFHNETPKNILYNLQASWLDLHMKIIIMYNYKHCPEDNRDMY